MNKEVTQQAGPVLPTQPEALLLEEFALGLKQLVDLHEQLVTNSETARDTVLDFDQQVRAEMVRLRVLTDQLEQLPVVKSNLVQVLLWTAGNIVDTINLTVERQWADGE